MTGFELWRRAMVGALLFGRGWVWIDRDELRRPIGLYNLLPDRTEYYRHQGRLCVMSEVDGEIEALDAADVLVIEGVALTEAECPGVVKAARQDLALALATRSFGSSFFTHNATLGGILQAPTGAPTAIVKQYEDAIDKRYRGSKRAFRTLVLEDGFKWQSTQASPKETQLTELDDATTRAIARWFCLAPSRVGARESVSYNSNESDRKAYVDQTLSHWLMSIQTQATTKLLSEDEYENDTHKIEHQVNALLYADAKTLSEIGNRGILNGTYCADEVRDWSNMNPRPDGLGGIYYQPLNMIRAGTQPPEADPPTPDDQPTDPAPDTSTDTRAQPMLEELRSAALACLSSAVERAARRLRIAGERRKPLTDERSAIADYVDREATLCRAAGLDVAGNLVDRLIHDAESAAGHGDPATWDGFLASVRYLLPPL